MRKCNQSQALRTGCGLGGLPSRSAPPRDAGEDDGTSRLHLPMYGRKSLICVMRGAQDAYMLFTEGDVVGLPLRQGAHDHAGQTVIRMRHSSGVGKHEVVRVWLLGNFRVAVGPLNIEEDRWRLRKAGSLVKLLALARTHRLHREQVMDVLWPDLDQRSQANNLYRTLHVARRTLGNGATDTDRRYLSLRGDVVSLYPDGPIWTDVQAFEEAAAYASSSSEPAAYRAALDLYSGDLLPEDPYEDWTQTRREGLRQIFLDLLVEIALIHEEREDYTSAVEALRRAVAEEPVNEEAHRGLMRLYARGGRRQQALSQYQQLEKALGRQLETAPDTASRRLHQEILTNRLAGVDPSSAGRAWEAHWRNSGNHNLPHAHSSFVGRQRELVEAKRALAMTRTMTLTGAGGAARLAWCGSSAGSSGSLP